MQRSEHVLDTAGKFFIPLAQHVAHLHALQVLLAAAQRAGNDGEVTHLGPLDQVFLADIGHGPDHHMFAGVTDQFGRHAFQARGKKHVQKKSLQHVVTVVTQRNLGGAQLFSHAIQNTAAQARAQRTHGLAFGNHAFDDAVGVLRFNVERHTEFFQILGKNVVGKTGLLLVQVDGNQLEVDGRARLQLEQNVQHGVAVFATRHANHDLVAFLDHVEVHNRAAHLTAQAFFELVFFALDFDTALCRGLRVIHDSTFQVIQYSTHEFSSIRFTTGRSRRESPLHSRQKSPALQFLHAHPARRVTASAGGPACRSGFPAG